MGAVLNKITSLAVSWHQPYKGQSALKGQPFYIFLDISSGIL